MVIRPGIQTVGKTVKAQWNMWSAATLIKTMVQEQLAHKKSMDSSSTTTSSAVSIHDLPDSMVIVEGVEERHPAKLTIKKTVIAEKSKQKTRAVPTESEEDDIEARLCLELGQLPGVWPTHKLTKVNGYWAMIQECAGYKTESGYKAVELSDMADFAAENLLSINDQIMFLNMIEDTLKGIQSIHKKGYIHRDIKPQNALCGNRGRAGISDIGEACKNELDNNAKRSIVGTPYYIAPEIVRYNNPAVGSDQWKQIDTKADIWSLGVCLWHLLNKEKHPSISFLGTNPVGAAYKAGSFFLPQINTLYENKYPEPQDKDSLAHLIWQCTRVEPTARLDINEVVSKYQRWKEEAIEMVKAEEKNVMEFLVG
jgi:hypothetical protein